MASPYIHNPYAKRTKRSLGNEVLPQTIHGTCTANHSSSTCHRAAQKVPSGESRKPSSHAASSMAAALVISATDKAGMDGIDRTRIDEIILRESGDSLFMRQQRRRDEKVNERIEELKQKLQAELSSNPDWRRKLESKIDQEIPNILSKRRKRSCCVVVDMDMFYMACELLSRPELKDRPACVGGSMITTSNYVARKYGVRSAMAGWIGDKLVEELSRGQERLIHVPHNFELYREKSMVVRHVLAEYDPSLRAYSLDEVYLDLAPYMAWKLQKGWDHEKIRDALAQSDMSKDERYEIADEYDVCKKQHGRNGLESYGYEDLLQYPASACDDVLGEVLRSMRDHVFQATGGLTCSAGAAPNFLLAKIASDRNKPNGQLVVGSSHEDVTSFLYPLAPRKVGGIGRVTDKILSAFSISSIGELYKQRALVRFLFPPASASNLLYASLGCSSSDDKVDDDDDEAGPSQKGISRERTFRAGKPWNEILSRLQDISALLSSDMKRKGFWARNICVKVKLHTFDCLSRSRTMPFGINLQESEHLFANASELLSEMRAEFKSSREFSVRLLGIRCSSIVMQTDRSKSLEHFFERFPQGSTPSAVQSPTTGLPLGDSMSKNRVKRALHQAEAPLTMSTKVYCPLCRKEFSEDENFELNTHVDSCLNSETIRNAVQESRTSSVRSSIQKTCLDYFGVRRKNA